MTFDHEIGSFWKEPQPFVSSKPWYVQHRGFREAYRTKAQAVKVAKAVTKLEKSYEECNNLES
jgi:hypothetical protein